MMRNRNQRTDTDRQAPSSQRGERSHRNEDLGRERSDEQRDRLRRDRDRDRGEDVPSTL